MKEACLRVTMGLLLAVMFTATAASDEGQGEPASITWHHEGAATIADAANEAKSKRKRLLIGLSGAPT